MSPLVNGFVDGSHEVVHGRLARGFLCLAAPHGRDRYRWPLMSRFAETQPVRGRRTARAVTDSLAACRGLSIGNGRQWLPGTAKTCRAPSPESNPRGIRDATTGSLRRAGSEARCSANDDRPWCSSVSPTDSTPRALSTVATASRRDARSPAAVPSGFGRWHLRGGLVRAFGFAP